MRAFLAFEVSKSMAERIEEVERELRGTRADVSIVPKENVHFTVKFLGDVPEDTPTTIDERTKRLHLDTFEVRVKGLGVFPDLRRPRVVWLGVAQEDEPTITRTARQVIDVLEGVGVPDDRKFRPHLTLGRVRSPRNVDSLISFVRANQSRELGTTTITSLKLKSSALTPRGAVYTDIREYRLN